MRAALDQRDETDLRIGALAVTGAGAPESLLVGGIVGDIERAAVQTDQPPALVPGASSRGRGDGAREFVVQPHDRFKAEPGPGLRNARLARNLARGRPLQPTQALQ